MNEDKDAPVGIFDSGVGGISVLREAVRVLPHERYIYYGDTAYAPYGTKPADEVLERVLAISDFLLARRVKALVIACNTATGVAAQSLRERLQIPVIGMEPALKPASEMRRGGSVLVMATPVTLSQPKFSRLMEQYGEGAIAVPCPGLMEFVERGALHGSALHAYLADLLSPFRERQIDCVVLGCTHYVFLRDEIRAFFPDSTQVIDGNGGTVRQLKRRLEEIGVLRTSGEGGVVFETSLSDPQNLQKMRALLDLE